MVIFYHLAGLPWGRNFYPHTHPIPIPMGIPMVIPMPTAEVTTGDIYGPMQCCII